MDTHEGWKSSLDGKSVEKLLETLKAAEPVTVSSPVDEYPIFVCQYVTFVKAVAIRVVVPFSSNILSATVSLVDSDNNTIATINPELLMTADLSLTIEVNKLFRADMGLRLKFANNSALTGTIVCKPIIG